MNADRKTMETALKASCIPSLRKLGFKGSFPNLYRETDGFVSLVNFQFYSAGGSFCVNLGYADPQRKNVYFHPETDADKLKVSQTKDRFRLGATQGGDRWFSFGETSYQMFRGQPGSVEEIALTCSELLATEAEIWWLTKQTPKV